jgi:LmbE family N-acetylglucosaminyl deacetylase
MKFKNSAADIFVPDGNDFSKALERTTHLSIAAHQDDTEVFAYHGIAECFGRKDRWFTSVVVTNGSGSARTGIYKDYTDEEMMLVRRQEQRKAAYVGEYSAQIQLDYPSSAIKNPNDKDVIADIVLLLSSASPSTVYLHNPADKHETHVAVFLRSIEAIRALPKEKRPKRAFGCEVWRDLDWLMDSDKSVLPVSRYENIAASLIGIFDSQISGGKRYDLATAGRRLANATYYASHKVDEEKALAYAIDLSPLLLDDSLSVENFIGAYIDRFKDDVISKIKKIR